MAESGPAKEDAAASSSPSPGPGPCPRRWERLRLAAGPWARSFGFLAALSLLYFLRGPLRLRDNLVAVLLNCGWKFTGGFMWYPNLEEPPF